MGSDDVDQYINSSHDFYELLGILSSATEEQIRRGYRQSALKYHPDKAGDSKEAQEKFELVQIANDLLSDPSIRARYDNAREARNRQKERESALDSQRKKLLDDLLERENASKRDREEKSAEEREYARLAADGKRRRVEYEQRLRDQAAEEERQWERRKAEQTPRHHVNDLTGADDPQSKRRVVVAEFRKSESTEKWDQAYVRRILSRYGEVKDLAWIDKKRKVSMMIRFVDTADAERLLDAVKDGRDMELNELHKVRRELGENTEHDSEPQPSSPPKPKPRKEYTREETFQRLRNAEQRRLAAKAKQEGREVDHINTQQLSLDPQSDF